MSKYGSASYCYQCEKKIPWSARCVWCRNPLCYTCKCNCPLAQPNSTPMNPKHGGLGPVVEPKP